MDTMCTKLKKPYSTLFLLFIITFFFNINKISAADIDGAKLFRQNCAVCHSLGTDKITGPGLAGVTSRVPQPYEDWMLKWIKNNAAVRASGDAYATKLFADNNQAAMTVFASQLSDDQIKGIIAFLKNPPKVEDATTPVVATTSNAAPQESGVNPLYVLIAILIFLIIIVSVLRGVKRSLKNVINQKKGRPEAPDTSFVQETSKWMLSHKLAVALMCIFLLGWGCTDAWEYLWNIHVYPGYEPTQPIKFSHKIHAGDNNINCIYCHSGAEKGKTAGIPSVNVCMNCHKGITKGPTTGTTEIAKIYYAAGWDVKTQLYDLPQHPIHWNRVHNLPDFSYFNHSQHVVVGQQKCQTCHGEVQTFTVDHQFAPLTMGWCVNCHRTTEVKMAGNPYYDELHKKLEEKYKGQKITVDKMGGIECGKCHY
ncbi:MAG: c-type cytochrome [Bacteroidia bacterium]